MGLENFSLGLDVLIFYEALVVDEEGEGGRVDVVR
jgi:hypothetical protein